MQRDVASNIASRLCGRASYISAQKLNLSPTTAEKAKFGNRTLLKRFLNEVIDKLSFILYNTIMQKSRVIFNIVILCLLIGTLLFTLVSINHYGDSDVLSDNSIVTYAESNVDNKENEATNQKKETTDLRGWITITISVLALVVSVLNAIFSIRKNIKDNKKEIINNQRRLIDELNKFKEGLKKTITKPIECRHERDFPYDSIIEIIGSNKVFTSVREEFECFCDIVDRFFLGKEEENNVIQTCNNLCEKIRALACSKRKK